MSKLLRRLLAGKERQPGTLITGIVAPGTRNGGWSVSWAGDGAWPPRLQAASLTQAADQAASAVAALYARHPPVAGAELQLAIYPWAYEGDLIFDITGDVGALTARDVQGRGRAASGATLEDVVAAVRRMTDVPDGHAMFRWVRQIASLPLPAASP